MLYTWHHVITPTGAWGQRAHPLSGMRHRADKAGKNGACLRDLLHLHGLDQASSNSGRHLMLLGTSSQLGTSSHDNTHAKDAPSRGCPWNPGGITEGDDSVHTQFCGIWHPLETSANVELIFNASRNCNVLARMLKHIFRKEGRYIPEG